MFGNAGSMVLHTWAASNVSQDQDGNRGFILERLSTTVASAEVAVAGFIILLVFFGEIIFLDQVLAVGTPLRREEGKDKDGEDD